MLVKARVGGGRGREGNKEIKGEREGRNEVK